MYVVEEVTQHIKDKTVLVARVPTVPTKVAPAPIFPVTVTLPPTEYIKARQVKPLGGVMPLNREAKYGTINVPIGKVNVAFPVFGGVVLDTDIGPRKRYWGKIANELPNRIKISRRICE